MVIIYNRGMGKNICFNHTRNLLLLAKGVWYSAMRKIYSDNFPHGHGELSRALRVVFDFFLFNLGAVIRTMYVNNFFFGKQI